MITVSIVSHGHGAMLLPLLEALFSFPEVTRVVLTFNIPETLNLPPHPKLSLRHNIVPKGFGANHNAAFSECDAPYFAVLNPDLQLPTNPFPALLIALQTPSTGVVAPRVTSPTGLLEDSVRHFPTLGGLWRKLVFGERGCYTLLENEPYQAVDWAAGMFLLFNKNTYAMLNGFDEGYFLYYEDVDICVRTWKAGHSVLVCSPVSVIHAAQRESHRDFKFLRWHLSSMARYFMKYWLRLPKI